MVRVLVTGGAGFIGSHLVEALLNRGDGVVVLDNFDDFYNPLEKRRNLDGALRNKRMRLVEGDLRSIGVDGALGVARDYDHVVHLAARAGVRPSLERPTLYAAHNVEGTAALLQWVCADGRAPSVVFASSSSVYGDATPVPFQEDAAPRPISPYGATKVAGESLIDAYAASHGLRGTSLRFFTVYGPRQRPDLAIRRFATAILAGEPISRHGDGSTSRDYTHIDDIVRGVITAMDRSDALPERRYNLGSDRGVTLNTLIESIERACGAVAKVRVLPEQPGDVKHTWADLSRSRRDLVYDPRVSFEDGIRDVVRWLRR